MEVNGSVDPLEAFNLEYGLVDVSSHSADPHDKASYLVKDSPSLTSHLRSSAQHLLDASQPLVLALRSIFPIIATAAILLVLLLTSSQWVARSSARSVSSLSHVDTGGATSGVEVNLYRTRAVSSSSSFTLPSTTSLATFPPLASLIAGHSTPGLELLLRCTANSTRRMAVMTSIAPFPTAAEVGLALLDTTWCTIVIRDNKGPSFAQFTAPAQLDSGIKAYVDKMTYTKQTDTPSAAAISHSRLLERIAYIDVSEQKLLPYSLSALTPYGSFSRKNLGFLLAFHCQASIVFDVDDDNIYLPNTATTCFRDLPVQLRPSIYPSSEQLDVNTKGKVDLSAAVRDSAPKKADLTPLNVSVFNPYPLYGAEDAWPRGYPLNYIRASLAEDGTYHDGFCVTTERQCTAVVQQMLANQDPDVDAIFRLTNEKGMPFYFLAPGREQTKPEVALAAPSIAMPKHTLAPFNAQATLITPGAFFAMLLPFTVHGRVSDIWRSYIMETLLTYYTVDAQQRVIPTLKSTQPSTGINSSEPCVVFTSPHIYHDRNAHNYQLDFNSELPLYMSAESLVSFLTTRQAGGAMDLRTGSEVEAVPMSDIMWRLYVELYEAAVVEEEELDYVQAWLSDIKRMPQTTERLTEQDADSTPSSKCWPKYAH